MENFSSNSSSPYSTTVKTVSKKGTPKNKWTPEEDKKLIELINENGPFKKKWTIIAEHFPNRTGKQCRERWLSNLDPSINKKKERVSKLKST